MQLYKNQVIICFVICGVIGSFYYYINFLGIWQIERKEVKEIESVKLQFYKYNIFVPNTSISEPILMSILQEMQLHNFTEQDIVKLEYINRIIDVTKKIYQEKNITSINNEESFSNIAVMDNEDNYVSLVT